MLRNFPLKRALGFAQNPYDVDNNVHLTLWLAKEPVFRVAARAYSRSLPTEDRESYRRMTRSLPLDFDRLEALPYRTLGRELMLMGEECGIPIKGLAQDYGDLHLIEPWPVARFFKTHDVHHLVTGLFPDTQLNEIALQAFMVGTGEAEMFSLLNALAQPITALRTQPGWGAAWVTWFKYFVIGRKYHGIKLFLFDYENHWDKPLDQVRERLGLPLDGLIGV